MPSPKSCAIDSVVRTCTSSPSPAAAAIFIARERSINVWSCCIRFLQSHRTRVQPLVVAIPFAKPAISCLDFLSSHATRPDRICNPFPAKTFHASHSMDFVMIRPPGINNGAFVVSLETAWYARVLLLFSASAATDTRSKSFDCVCFRLTGICGLSSSIRARLQETCSLCHHHSKYSGKTCRCTCWRHRSHSVPPEQRLSSLKFIRVKVDFHSCHCLLDRIIVSHMILSFSQ